MSGSPSRSLLTGRDVSGSLVDRLHVKRGVFGGHEIWVQSLPQRKTAAGARCPEIKSCYRSTRRNRNRLVQVCIGLMHCAGWKGEGGAMATQNKRMALVCAGL